MLNSKTRVIDRKRKRINSTMCNNKTKKLSTSIPVREAKKQRNTIRKQARENPADEQLKREMKAATFKLAESYRNEMEKHVNEVAEQVEPATLDRRYQIAWPAVNRLSGRKARKMYKASTLSKRG